LRARCHATARRAGRAAARRGACTATEQSAALSGERVRRSAHFVACRARLRVDAHVRACRDEAIGAARCDAAAAAGDLVLLQASAHMLAFQQPAACVTESAVPPHTLRRAVAVWRHAARAAGPLNELCNPHADRRRAFRRILRHSPSQHRPSKRRCAARRGRWLAEAPTAPLHVLCSTLFAPHFALCRVQRTAATPATTSSPGTPVRFALGAAPRRLLVGCCPQVHSAAASAVCQRSRKRAPRAVHAQ
jgi:hypothetical protein